MATHFFSFKFNKLNKSKAALFFTGILFLCLQTVHAEYYSFKELNFTMDIPEGFELKETGRNYDSLFFETKLMPVKFALKLYPAEQYADAKAVIDDTLVQLNAKGSVEEFDWYGRDCFLSAFSFVMPDQKLYSGWALSIQVPLKENQAEKVNMLFLTYADSQISRDCDQYMLSIIDGVFFCQEDFRRPGPVTTFAFPKTKDIQVNLDIAGTSINSAIESEAVERSNFVIEREYAVLRIYANQQNWKEAWQRYYRLIFRESYSALDEIADDIYKKLLPKAQKISFEDSTYEIAKMLLDWVQDFNYVRDTKNADFTAVTASIQGYGSDCDSRSMLMCILMEHFGIQTKLFISREYSHAIFGLNLKKNGAKITCDGTDFLLGETTAKVDLGLIAKEQSVTEKWIPVDLP